MTLLILARQALPYFGWGEFGLLLLRLMKCLLVRQSIDEPIPDTAVHDDIFAVAGFSTGQQMFWYSGYRSWPSRRKLNHVLAHHNVSVRVLRIAVNAGNPSEFLCI